MIYERIEIKKNWIERKKFKPNRRVNLRKENVDLIFKEVTYSPANANGEFTAEKNQNSDKIGWFYDTSVIVNADLSSLFWHFYDFKYFMKIIICKQLLIQLFLILMIHT